MGDAGRESRKPRRPRTCFGCVDRVWLYLIPASGQNSLMECWHTIAGLRTGDACPGRSCLEPAPRGIRNRASASLAPPTGMLLRSTVEKTSLDGIFSWIYLST
jgi:hypothetical protein